MYPSVHNLMKHGLLAFFLTLATLTDSLAQEAIYFANGDKLPNARLIDATDEKVVLSVKRDGSTGQYKFQRSNVLMAFNAMGDFLVIASLPGDATEARQRIEQFSAATTPAYKSDFLVKAVPLTVIQATISYESDQVVNYKTAQGLAASISKDELIMILRRDGRHQLVMPPTDIVSLLPSIRKQIESGGTPAAPVPTVAATRADPVSAMPAPQPASSQPDSARQAPASVLTTTTPIPATVPAVVVVVNTAQPSEPTVTYPVSADSKATLPEANKGVRPALSEADFLIYREKAMRRVSIFSDYLNIITDKALSTARRDQAIEQAAKLFLPTATIEVTSKSRPGSRRYPIREYLTRLKILPYSHTNIEWSEIQYIRELTQAADGKYYGTLTGQQTFTGYDSNGRSMYTDVTRKNVRVQVDPYEKIVNGETQLNWEVLLGNIGVANN